MAGEAQVRSVQEVLDNDPAIQAALRQIEEMRRQGVPIIGSGKQSRQTGQRSLMGWAQDNLQPLVQRALQERGLQMPHDWGISLGQDGNRVGQLNRKGFWDRNVDWIAPVIVGGAGVAGGLGAAGAFGGGSGASGTLAATTPALSTGTLAPTVTPALSAGVGGGVGAGGGATAALTSTMPALTDLASTVPAATGAGFAPAATSALGAGGAAGGGAVAGGGILSSLLSNPETYATVAGLLGNMGREAGAERQGENAFSLDSNRAAASIFGAQQSAATRAKEAEEVGKLNRSELESRNASAEEDAKRYRSQLGITAPAARTRQSLWGSMIQNIQPVSVNVPDRLKDSLVTYEGGLSPALINDLARESGAELQRQAHSALLNRSDIPSMTQLPAPPPMTDFSTALLTPPEQTPYRQPGAFESGTSAGATAASIGGIVAALLANRNKNRSGGSMEPPETAGG